MTLKQWLTKHNQIPRFKVFCYNDMSGTYRPLTSSYTLYKHYQVDKEEEYKVGNLSYYNLYIKKN